MKIIPEFIVKDISKSIDFYQNNFGFKLDNFVPENPPFIWVQLSLDDTKIMLQDLQETIRELKDFPNTISSTPMFVLKFDDKDYAKKLYQTFKAKDIQFFMDLTETDYGTIEYGILDPDNHKLLISVG
jgi:uncharacterized glyoxalase superfamily protein PhnB